MVKTRRAEHAEDTRAALLASARELFVEQGYAATSLSEIVRRARVTTGALYHHFADKKQLLREVIADTQEEMLATLVERFTRLGEQGELDNADLWDLARFGANAYLDALDSRLLQLWRVEAPAVLGLEEARELARRAYLTTWREYLERAMDQGLIAPLPLEPLTDLLGAMLGEATTYVAHADDRETARTQARQVVDQIFEGLRRSRSETP